MPIDGKLHSAAQFMLSSLKFCFVFDGGGIFMIIG